MKPKKPKLKYKIGDVLIRVPSNQDYEDYGGIFEPGILLKVTEITEKKYKYKYLNLKSKKRGFDFFGMIEDTCTKVSPTAQILYGKKKV